MKLLVITLIILCTAILGGGIYYLDQIQIPLSMGDREMIFHPAPATAPEPTPLPPLQPLPPVTAQLTAAATMAAPVAVPAVSVAPAEAVANHIAQVVDTLLSSQTGFSQKHALWRQLHDSGELDQVITELKQRAADHPTTPEYPMALGEAFLNKFPVDDFNQAAMLGLQADQSFDAALKLDPANWEAQYFKAASMSYWPVSMNKGQEVIQRLSNLIDQQEASPTQQPQFAQTYALLGDQYLKAGQTDYAQQTWKLGTERFPNDAGLQMKLGGPGKGN